MTHHDWVQVDGYNDVATVLRFTTDDHAEVKFRRGLITFVPTSAIHRREDP